MKLRQVFFLVSLLLLTGCNEGLKVREMQWSATGDYLAVSTRERILFFDGREPYTLSPFIIEPVASPDFSWSPLQNKLVYTDAGNKGWDLVLFNVEGQEKSRLTDDLAKDFLPRYLNAEEILFFSDREGVIAPWRYQLSTQRIDSQNEKRLPPLPEEGLSDDKLSSITVKEFKEGSLIQGTYKEKKWKWKEPLLQLRLPRWAPDNQRCAFAARNPEMMKDEFLWVLDFENKTSRWVPLLPQHLLSFADFFSKRGEWERAFKYDRRFLDTYPEDQNASAAYLREAYYFLNIQINLKRVETALSQILERFPDAEVRQDARYWLAIAFALEKEREKAVRQFEAFLENASAEKEDRYKEVQHFSLLLKNEKLSDGSLATFFQSVVHEKGGREDAALSGYLALAKTGLKNELGAAAIKRGAGLWLKKGKSKKALQLWDKLILNAQNKNDKEEGKLNYALLLEKELNQPEKAAEIYLKIDEPFRAAALKQLFYLNREVFFDFSKSEMIGDAFLKDYPGSRDWSGLYDELEKLKTLTRRSIPDKELSLFYQAGLYEKEGKSGRAVNTYEEILSQTELKFLKRECYKKIADISVKLPGEELKTVKAALSYLTTFEKGEADPPEKTFLNQTLFEPSLKMIQSKQTGKLDNLLRAFIKKVPENQYRFLADLLLVLTFYSQESWDRAHDEVFFFLKEGENGGGFQRLYFEEQIDEIRDFAAVLALSCAVHRENWDDALKWTNRLYVTDWKNLIRRHREWIDLYRLNHPKELKELLDGDLLNQSEMSLIVPDAKSKSVSILEYLVFEQPRSEIKAHAILLLSGEYMDQARQNPEKKKEIRGKLYELVSILNQDYPGSVWGGRLALRLAEFDSEEAFYVLALSTYGKVIERFKGNELEEEALWLKGDLYWRRLDRPDEALRWLRALEEKETKSVWKRKARLALGKIYSAQEDNLQNSVSVWKDLIQTSPSSPEAAQARLELGNLFFETLDEPEKALPLYNEIVEKENGSNKELKWKIRLIEAGKKAVRIWKQIQSLDVKTEAEKGNKLFKKLMDHSGSGEFKLEAFNRWIAFIQESGETGNLLPVYAMRIRYPLNEEEWASLFESIESEMKKGNSEAWQKLLAEWSKNKEISSKNQSRIALLRAKAALWKGDKEKAEKFLRPWLREKSIPKEIVRHYWLSRKKG